MLFHTLARLQLVILALSLGTGSFAGQLRNMRNSRNMTNMRNMRNMRMMGRTHN